jgi:hypothetical protein
MLTIKPDINTERLLKSGELKTLFSNLDVISYSEGWIDSDHNSRKAVASLVGRKDEC